ncbi:HNH endonuclease [Caulobacter sp. FWC2]|uniref:HNH endonuclease n=1 Tax=Caulobacter sp. FWC2 TaxID=69664 RepID=UPI001304092E|nr:HNH endonuclease [Caulobacter sp. FWC2]
MINGRDYRAHRIIWLIQTGEWPANDIDHINGARDDNRWVNLRDVSGFENHRNKIISPRNTSGVNGIHYEKARKKWQVRIKSEGRSIALGRFDTLEEAIAARAAADAKHGFSPRHGSSRL